MDQKLEQAGINGSGKAQHMKPELTEIERLKMENFTLKFHLAQQSIQQVQTERAAFIRTLEGEHPGWAWRDPDGFVEIASDSVQ